MGIGLGLLTAAQFGYGIYNSEKQRKEADKIRKSTVRPKYRIPDATKELVRKTAFDAGTYGLPGQGQMEARLDQSGAATRRSIRESGLSPAAMMAAYAASQGVTDSQQTQIGINAAQHRERANSIYNQSLQLMAGQEQNQWDWDSKEKYLDATAAASALENAYLRNQESAVNTLFGNVGNMMMMNNSNNANFQTGSYPANVDPTYRAPQTGYGQTVPSGNGVEIPGTLNYREGDTTMRDSSVGAENMGPVRTAFNPADPSMIALKQQLETQYGYRLSDTEFMEIARLYGY